MFSGISLPGLTIFMYQLQRNIRACNCGLFTTCRNAILNEQLSRGLDPNWQFGEEGGGEGGA